MCGSWSLMTHFEGWSGRDVGATVKVFIRLLNWYQTWQWSLISKDFCGVRLGLGMSEANKSNLSSSSNPWIGHQMWLCFDALWYLGWAWDGGGCDPFKWSIVEVLIKAFDLRQNMAIEVDPFLSYIRDNFLWDLSKSTVVKVQFCLEAIPNVPRLCLETDPNDPFGQLEQG